MTLLIILHVLISLALILVILLQSGKGGGLAGTFGGGESATVFGSRGATTALTKATTGLAIAFMLVAMIITWVSGLNSESKSVLKERLQSQGVTGTQAPQPFQPVSQPQPTPAQTPAAQPDVPSTPDAQATPAPAEQPAETEASGEGNNTGN